MHDFLVLQQTKGDSFMCGFKHFRGMARQIGTSREERTNSSLPPKKDQKEKNKEKELRIKNEWRRQRRSKAEAQKIDRIKWKQAGREGLEHTTGKHGAKRSEPT